LRTERQPEVGEEAYDAGAEILRGFFKDQLKQYDERDLMPEGRRIIECFLDDGAVEQYQSLIESDSIFVEE
jgi:hypothetical protein